MWRGGGKALKRVRQATTGGGAATAQVVARRGAGRRSTAPRNRDGGSGTAHTKHTPAPPPSYSPSLSRLGPLSPPPPPPHPTGAWKNKQATCVGPRSAHAHPTGTLLYTVARDGGGVGEVWGGGRNGETRRRGGSKKIAHARKPRPGQTINEQPAGGWPRSGGRGGGGGEGREAKANPRALVATAAARWGGGGAGGARRG